MSKKLTMMVLTFAATAVSATASALDAAAPPATTGVPQGSGQLKIMAEPPRTPPAAAVPLAERQHRITVQITPSGGSSAISGPVTIKGMATVNSGDMGEVDWQVSDSKVSGAVTHSGNATTTFEGTITTAGANGSFTLPGGLRGEWSWDGPLPQ